MFRKFMVSNKFKMFNLTILVFVLIPFAISCSQQKGNDPEEKFHEVKDYSIKYDLSGAQKGQKVVYSQDWGKCVMQIIGDQKTISLMEDGEQYVISVDTTKNTGTKMLNPIYKSLLESLNAKTPKEFNLALLEKMGGKVVGEKKIAGNSCKVWELMEGLQKTCITEDGIILESESTIGGVERGEIATEVIRGSTEGFNACDTGDAKIEFVDIGQMLQQQEVGAPKLEFKPKESTKEDGIQQENSAEETKE